MLCALARAGRAPRLLVYSGGLSQPGSPPYRVYRGPTWAHGGGLRSGPSLAKLRADLGLALQLRALPGELLIAHHVEAALISWPRPSVFFAHTDLGAELPSYAPALPPHALARAGSALDRLLVRRAAAVATVSPQLRERMAALAGPHGERVRYVPIPWPLSPPSAPDERAAARAQLGLSAGTRVVAYAGNLDGYPGWDTLVGTVAQLNRRCRPIQLLVATASDATPLRQAMQRAELASRLTVVPLAGEDARVQLHAGADVIAIPRRVAGGIPIKLLDALSRGAACVLTRSAHAGLPLADAALVADGDDVSAFAAAIERVLARSVLADSLRANARAYVAREHSDEAFLTAFDAVCASADPRPKQQVSGSFR